MASLGHAASLWFSMELLPAHCERTSPSVIRISRGPDQAQLGQETIPVVIVMRSISARLSMCSHFGQMCTLSQCLVSRGFGLSGLIRADGTQQREAPLPLTEVPVLYSLDLRKRGGALSKLSGLAGCSCSSGAYRLERRSQTQERRSEIQSDLPLPQSGLGVSPN
jgi:hypothetical protein